MNEQKLKNVEQWLEALQESARTAVEALTYDTPLGKDPPSLDERSRNLGAAIHKIRELVRPEPKTVAFLEEETWYQMKGAAKPAGEYHAPPAAIDAIMANPPLGEAAAVGARVPRARDGEDHMSKVDAAKILAVLAAGRTRTEDEVTALEMGARQLCTRWFQQQRGRARRLAGDGSPHPVPEVSEVPEVPANPGEEVAI